MSGDLLPGGLDSREHGIAATTDKDLLAYLYTKDPKATRHLIDADPGLLTSEDLELQERLKSAETSLERDALAFNSDIELPRGFRVEARMVGPDLAAEWLTANIANRNPSPMKQAQYGRDARAGRWLLTGQPIQFDWDGNLIDGQNRLQMIIKTDVQIPLLVVYGLDPRVRFVIDTGKARIAGDGLKIRGVPNANLVAAVARKHIDWNRHDIWGNKVKPSPDEVIEWLESKPDELIQGAAILATRAQKQLGKGFGGTGAWGFFYLLLTEIDAEDAQDFFEAVLTGLDLWKPGETDPRYVLRERVRRNRWTTQSAYINLAGYVVTAWNAFREGRPISKLQAPRSNGWSYDNLPEPK